jgi:hypothetical protein
MTEMSPRSRGRTTNNQQTPVAPENGPQYDIHGIKLGIRDIESKLRPGARPTDPLDVAVDLYSLYPELSARYGVPYGKKPTTVFRSFQLPEIDELLIGGTDYNAQLGAAWSPGFNYYFKGDPLDRISMSFCAWESVQEAMQASKHPAHLLAMQLAPMFYESAFVEHLVIDYQPGGITVSDLREPTVIPYNTTQEEAEHFWASQLSYYGSASN